MTRFALIGLLIAGVLAVVLVLLGLRLARRAVIHGRRRAAEVRSHFLPAGPRRDAALLRQQLAAELRITRQMFAAAPNSRIFQADPVAVLAEAAGFAQQLDHELALIESYPDRSRQQAALATISPQVLQLIDTIYSARLTMLRTAAMDRTKDLSGLSESVAREADSLRNYEQAKRDLTI